MARKKRYGLDDSLMSQFQAEYDRNAALSQPQQQPQKPSKGFLLDQLSTLGGIGGSLGGAASGAALGSVVPIVGTAAGGILGALLGGALGGGAGEAAENIATGDDLMKNVGKEAALNGLFGAGPIRAGSLVARTAGGLARGAGKDALSQAGTKAVTDTPIRNLIGSKLGQVSDNAAIRGLGLTGSQMGKVEAKAGGKTTAQLIKSEGLHGASPEDITAHIGTLNKQFGDIVTKSGDVPKTDIIKALTSVQKNLTKAGTTADDTRTAQSLAQELDVALGKFKGDTISAKDLNKLKSRFDANVNYNAAIADPAKYSTDKRAADLLRDVLRAASEKSGAAGAGELKALGSRLSSLRTLEEKAIQQSRVGKGNGPIGMRDVVMGAGGTVAGGPIGGLATMAATHAANSRTGQKLLSKATGAVGDKLTSSGGANALGLPAIATREGIMGALTGGEGLQQPQQAQEPQQPGLAALGAQSGTMQAAEPSIGGVTKSQLEQAMMAALADGNSDAFNDLKKMHDLLDTGNTRLGQTAAGQVAASDNAINTLDQLDQLYGSAGGGSNVIQGNIQNTLGNLGLDNNAKVYNDLAASSVSQLARALNGGGQVSDADAAVVVQALPRLTDTKEVAAAKIAALRARLENARNNTLTLNGAG
jgi:hypothetical protein